MSNTSKTMGEYDVACYLSNLASARRVSASTQNQALNAVLFLYREVLGKEIGYVNGVVRAKRPTRLPVVLTRQEVKAILALLDGPEWIMGMLPSAVKEPLRRHLERVKPGYEAYAKGGGVSRAIRL